MNNHNPLQLALQLLKRKDYHSTHLQQKLLDKGYHFDEVEETLNELMRRNFINDQLFLETQIYHYLKKGYSSQYTYQKLIAKKLPICWQQIDQVATHYQLTPDKQITFLLANFYRKNGKPQNDRDFARLARQLLSHGHESDYISDRLENLPDLI